jgi:hypothetical protein
MSKSQKKIMPITFFAIKDTVHFEFILQGQPLNQVYEGVSKSFRTGRLESELQMLQLSATRCSFIAIL